MITLNQYISEKLKIDKGTEIPLSNYYLLVTQDDNIINILDKKFPDCITATGKDYVYYVLDKDVSEKYLKWGGVYLYTVDNVYKTMDKLKDALENDNIDFDKIKAV